MNQFEAIVILESLKDLINDNGKREIDAVIKAINSWSVPEIPHVDANQNPIVPELLRTPLKVWRKVPITKPKKKK